jgi:signal transduction histidine kinase
MPVSRKEKSSIDFKGAVKSAQVKVTTSLTQIGSTAKKSGDKPLAKRIEQEKKKLKSTLLNLVTEATKLQKKFNQETRKVEAFKKKTERSVRLKVTGDTNNMLLEIKRKDLLQKAAEIEATYEEISKKHEELVRQKQNIAEQTEKLRIANQEILEKNQELETKAESLLDQADYLHEANETITNMHLELAKQKDEILSKNEELESLNSEKNNLIGIVAHDLKSPLNQIKGLVSLIKMTTQLEGEPVNCLNMIEASAIRLNSMIGKILDIEAIESKQLNLNMEPVDLTELLNGLADRFKLDANRKSIELIESIPIGISINIDRNYLTQILENLLSNAIKFSPSNKKIYLNLQDNGDHIIAEVRDEGPGLNDDDKKKLFSKYQKLSAKPTGSESSTGLGLSIVKKFTETMGGQIWCESELGKGASFFVKFYKSRS